MLFDKKLIKCKSNTQNEEWLHTIDYHKALSKVDDIRYKLVKTMMNGRAIVIDIDTTLLMPDVRLDPTKWAQDLKSKLADYQIKYTMNRMKKEVLDVGLGRIFGMKNSKVDVAYRVTLYVPYEKFTQELYKELLEHIGYRICILKGEEDIEHLLELFYSGMIEEYNLTDLFYGHFYCNEQLTQILLTTKQVDKDEILAMLGMVR
ncbi:MAG: hypothetical protein K0R69_2960 [Clostridia bacterium]|jgi:hypothetical protein|nr:hypothetical protein [Clostridia bacterium]